jgi:hypothetical protein
MGKLKHSSAAYSYSITSINLHEPLFSRCVRRQRVTFGLALEVAKRLKADGGHRESIKTHAALICASKRRALLTLECRVHCFCALNIRAMMREKLLGDRHM